MRNEKGWAELLANRCTTEQAISHNKITNLDIITSGSSDNNYLSALSNQQNIEHTLNTLKNKYEVIIINTSPLLKSSNAQFLMKVSDINILVFAYAQHSVEQIERILQPLKMMNIELLGFIFDLVPKILVR